MLTGWRIGVTWREGLFRPCWNFQVWFGTINKFLKVGFTFWWSFGLFAWLVFTLNFVYPATEKEGSSIVDMTCSMNCIKLRQNFPMLNILTKVCKERILKTNLLKIKDIRNFLKVALNWPKMILCNWRSEKILEGGTELSQNDLIQLKIWEATFNLARFKQNIVLA